MRNKIWFNIGLLIVLITGWGLRIWGINWDSGYHFHPDERKIIMVANEIRWVNPITDWETFSSIDSGLNPKFFAYGSFPIYLLSFASNTIGNVLGDRGVASYDGMLMVGRLLSAMFDTLTILVVFWIGRKIRDEKLGLISAFLYAIAVFPIQTSHFYAVDTLLSLLMASLLFVIISVKKISYKQIIIVGALIGLGLGTKASAVIGLIFWLLWLTAQIISPDKLNLNNKSSYWKRIVVVIKWGTLSLIIAIGVLSIVQPYMWYDKVAFWGDLSSQSRMRYDAWTFPYTRQYIGTKPYIYNVEQIVRFGLGIGQTVFVLLGIGGLVSILIKKNTKQFDVRSLIWGCILMLGFVVPFGIYSVKFMRYLLPIYPWLTILGGVGIIYATNLFTNAKRNFVYVGLGIIMAMTLLWTWGFMNIYNVKNTRISASIWINRNLKSGSTLAIEHWDDAIPVPPWGSQFQEVTLALYEPDNEMKWRLISQQLAQADAIVIASNRLYAPLTRLTDKYPVASEYYKKLFNNELGFKLELKDSNYPRIGNYEIADDEADESFHVYDHPKILVYKKKVGYTAEQYYDLITNGNLEI